MELNENCICPRKSCVRHGKCDECRAYHEAKGEKSNCDKKKQKAERKEQRSRLRSH